MTADLVALVARRQPDVVAFATALSLAVRIDRGLARAMRLKLAPSADVSLETDLWSSPLVQVRGDGECTLRASVAAALWQRLPSDPRELAALWSVYQARHVSPLVQLEERLAYLARLSALELPIHRESADDVIDRELRAVVAAMVADEPRRRDLAAWAARALARLPASVRDCEGGRILGAATAGWVAAPVEVAALTPSLEGAAVVRRLAPATARPQRTIAIRRTRDRIDVSPSRLPGWTPFAIAASPFAVYLDDDHEVRLDPHAITRIAVPDRDVVLGDADGKRWLVPRPRDAPDLSGLATITSVRGTGFAYLVSPTIAATSAQLVGHSGWTGEVRFPNVSHEGRVILVNDELDLALIQLAAPPNARPLPLRGDPVSSDVWFAYGSAAEVPARAVVDTVATGRVLAAGDQIRIEHAGVPWLMTGTPIFVAGQVIGHLSLRGSRSLDGPTENTERQELTLCSARVVEATLARLTEAPRSQSAVLDVVIADDRGARPQIALLVQPDLMLTVSASPPDDVPRLSGEVRVRPAFRVGSIAGFTLDPPLDVAPAPISVEGLVAGDSFDVVSADDIESCAVDSIRRRDPETVSVRCVRAPPVIGSGAAGVVVRYRSAAIGFGRSAGQLGDLTALRFTQPVVDAVRAHATRARRRLAEILLHQPLDLRGLFAARATVSRDAPYRTTGQTPWSIAIGETRRSDRATRFIAEVEPVALDEPMLIVPASVADEDLARAAVHRAASTLHQPIVLRDGPPRLLRVAMDTAWLPRSYAIRRAIRLFVETLFEIARAEEAPPEDRAVSAPPLRTLVHLQLRGAGALEPGTIDAWLRARGHEGARVVEVDPETGVVTIATSHPTAVVELFQRSEEFVVDEVSDRTWELDSLHGRFGLSAERRGYRLTVEADDELVLAVERTDDRPVRGYVRFYVPEDDGVPLQGRVRATDGRATYRPPWAVGERFTVGAIVEEDDVPLEAVVPMTTAALGHVGLVTKLPTQAWDCAVLSDGRTVAVASEDHLVRLVRLDRAGDHDSFRGHRARVFGCAVSSDQTRLVSASADRTVRVWDLATRNLIRAYEDHTGDVCACAITPDGERVVSVGADLIVRVWELGTGRTLHRLAGHTDRICDCAITPDGWLAVTASADRTLRVWNLGTGAEQAVLEGHAERVNSCRISPDGRLAVSASYDTTLKLWDLATGRLTRTLEGHTTPVETCAISPDGRWLASASRGGTLRLWDLRRGTCTINQARDGAAQTCAWIPGSNRLVTIAYHGEVRLWELDGGAPAPVPE